MVDFINQGFEYLGYFFSMVGNIEGRYELFFSLIRTRSWYIINIEDITIIRKQKCLQKLILFESLEIK